MATSREMLDDEVPGVAVPHGDRAGSVGIVTAIASLALSFTRASRLGGPRLAYLVIGVVVITIFARSRWFNRFITPAIE